MLVSQAKPDGQVPSPAQGKGARLLRSCAHATRTKRSSHAPTQLHRAEFFTLPHHFLENDRPGAPPIEATPTVGSFVVGLNNTRPPPIPTPTIPTIPQK